ncbi:MAG: hypothetical protein HDT21_02560 [Ruminococcus sp.]|nr:hypothetical protein [Ruminococcus sp.]
MNIYTVSFFGHREIENPLEIEKRLERLLHDIITQKEYVEFLIGREGEFDLLAASVIRRAVKNYGCGNTSLILVLPYMKAEYHNNKRGYLEYYDEIEVCSKSSEVHYKSAIQVRNRNMVNRSDLVICCIQRNSGGAYKTVQYAKKQNCRIVNLAEEN